MCGITGLASSATPGASTGQQVKHHLEGRPDPRFYKDPGTLLEVLSSHEQPVNLILSKWDCLTGFDLGQVAEGLLKIDIFEKFVESRRRHDGCRLIPVSAIGYEFAPEDGTGAMRKVPDATPHPIRVEVPIACSLPDALRAASEAEQPSDGTMKLGDWLENLKFTFGIPGIPGISFEVRHPVRPRPSASPHTPEAAKKLMRFFLERDIALEHDFPESNLVGFLDELKRRPAPVPVLAAQPELGPMPAAAPATQREGRRWFEIGPRRKG